MSEAWSHNLHYHDLVLRSVPSPCARALDVGCGEGLLTCRLAARCGDVFGIDQDHDVLAGLQGDSSSIIPVSFVTGDVMTYPFSTEGFDFIAAVATLHHLPLPEGMMRLRSLLKPGGVLSVIGLYRARTLADYLWAAAALPVSRLLQQVRGSAEMRAPMKVPEATLSDIRQTAQAVLPGAVLRRRFFFRYSLVWRKPE